MRNVKAILAAGLGVAATSAFAADATFQNHMTSQTMVSPAQLYQVKDLKTDFAVGYQSGEQTLTPDTGDKTTDAASGTNVFASAIYNINAIGLRAGLTADYKSLNFERKVGATKNEAEGTEMVFSPQVAMPFGPVVIGTAVDFHQQTETAKAAGVESERKVDFIQVRPAALFAMDAIEAGVAYETRRKLAAEKIDELPVSEPAVFTAHGRYALNRDLAFGGVIKNANYQGIDKDAFSARTTVLATGEFNAGAIKVEGDLGYNTAFHKEDKLMNESTIGTFQLGAAADYRVTNKAAVGGALGYEFGSDENTDTKQKFAKNELTFLVRGDVQF